MIETRDPSGWIPTYSGKQYWPLDPRVEDICIDDIAHGLSLICRYSGQCRHHYSVGEHSILVSLMVPPELALEGLLHDATEAYCGDVTRPLKKGLFDYRTIEDANAMVIRERFHLPMFEHHLVKEADANILHTELRQLFPPIPDWSVIPGTYDPSVRLFLWPPVHAEIAFLNRYRALVTARGIRNS